MIKRSLLLLTVGFSSQAALADTCVAPNPLNEYRLVFEENFDGSITEFRLVPSITSNILQFSDSSSQLPSEE